MIYKIEIQELVQKVIDVEADDLETAFEIVKKLYKTNSINLCKDVIVDTEMHLLNEDFEIIDTKKI